MSKEIRIVITGPEVALLQSLADHHLSEKKVNTELNELDKFAIQILETISNEQGEESESNHDASEH